jgi:hypothetical protein
MEVKIKVPTDLSDIPLYKYQEFHKVLEVNKDADANDLFIQEKMLQIFCDLPLSDALKYRKSDIDNVTEMITKTLEQKPDLVRNFTIGDTEFGFIPKLEDMTFGEYIDLDNSIGDIKNLHKAMAVLYRPIKQKIKEKYLIEDYRGDNYHQAMLHTPMDAVVSSMLFFWNLGIELSKAMIAYLQEEHKEDLTPEQISVLSGDGINQFMHLPMVTFQSLTK